MGIVRRPPTLSLSDAARMARKPTSQKPHIASHSAGKSLEYKGRWNGGIATVQLGTFAINKDDKEVVLTDVESGAQRFDGGIIYAFVFGIAVSIGEHPYEKRMQLAKEAIVKQRDLVLVGRAPLGRREEQDDRPRTDGLLELK